MTKSDMASQRLRQQGLTQPRFERPEEVVNWLGAVQAQDYAAAKWALALRSDGLTEAAIDQAFASGAILRTHVMRPTWHFVTPADIRWLLALTAPRVNATNAYYYRRLELDETVFTRSNAVLEKALQGGKHCTREELGDILQQAGIETQDRLRLSYLVLRAELDAILCSGPRRGKQFTYALLEERAPHAKVLDRNEALAQLTRSYFSGHGPATLQDFVWWSGLTTVDAKTGLDMADSYLTQEEIEGQIYWLGAPTAAAGESMPAVHLLPNFDEYIVGYKDRSAAFDAQDTKMENPRDNIVFNHTILVDGRVAGTWKRSFSKGQILMEARPFANFSAIEENALAEAVRSYGEFQGMAAILRIS
jgi:DNA glycosylase AlkZ-like